MFVWRISHYRQTSAEGHEGEVMAFAGENPISLGVAAFIVSG